VHADFEENEKLPATAPAAIGTADEQAGGKAGSEG